MRMLILLCRRLRGELSACVFFSWWRVAADGLLRYVVLMGHPTIPYTGIL